MNPYNFSLLFFSFCAFLIAIFVLLKRRDKVGKMFFLFSMTVSSWGIGHAIAISSNISAAAAIWADRFGHTGAVFIPFTWFLFTVILSNQEQKFKWLIRVVFIIAALTSLSTWTPWFISHQAPALEFGRYTRPGPLYHSYVAMFMVLVPIGFFNLAKLMKRVSSEEKFEIKGLFVATIFGFIGGSFAFFPVYDLMIPQYGYFLLPIYPFVMAYFMIRHHLFDMEAVAQAFQREKLATIGLIASSINHEIKNPLYVVRSMLETYVENTKEGLTSKDPLVVAEKAIVQLNRAFETINKLNRFTKPALDTSVDYTASIPDALKSVLDFIQHEFELDKIHIKNEIPADLPLIEADARQLEEVFFNLIVNACHAMKKKGGGTLTISVGRHCEPKAKQSNNSEIASARSGSLPRNDNTVTITISDTGTGISKDQMKHLFEPFYTTKGEQGTGLGLYITKQIIERNNGKITVKSEEGKGTQFVLEFKTK